MKVFTNDLKVYMYLHTLEEPKAKATTERNSNRNSKSSPYPIPVLPPFYTPVPFIRNPPTNNQTKTRPASKLPQKLQRNKKDKQTHLAFFPIQPSQTTSV